MKEPINSSCFRFESELFNRVISDSRRTPFIQLPVVGMLRTIAGILQGQKCIKIWSSFLSFDIFDLWIISIISNPLKRRHRHSFSLNLNLSNYVSMFLVTRSISKWNIMTQDAFMWFLLRYKNGHAFLQNMRLNVITGYCDSKYFCLILHFCNACSNRYVYFQNIYT